MNYRCRYGEIDIIAKDMDEDYITFVEVKYRKTTGYGMPYEAVTPYKQRRIILASKNYIRANKLSIEGHYRYDVISICDKDIMIIKNAFGGF